MDHLTRDPSCEFCKKALGPLYRHMKGKYGSRLEDQTPTLSFDFSGPFSCIGYRFSLYAVVCVAFIRGSPVVGICPRQTYQGKRAFLPSRCYGRNYTIDRRFETACDEGYIRIRPENFCHQW